MYQQQDKSPHRCANVCSQNRNQRPQRHHRGDQKRIVQPQDVHACIAEHPQNYAFRELSFDKGEENSVAQPPHSAGGSGGLLRKESPQGVLGAGNELFLAEQHIHREDEPHNHREYSGRHIDGHIEKGCQEICGKLGGIAEKGAPIKAREEILNKSQVILLGQIIGPGNRLVYIDGQVLLDCDGQPTHRFHQAGNNEKANKRRHQQYHKIGQGYSGRPLELMPEFRLNLLEGTEGQVLEKVHKDIEDIGDHQAAQHRGQRVAKIDKRGPDLVKAQHRQRHQGGKSEQQAAIPQGLPVMNVLHLPLPLSQVRTRRWILRFLCGTQHGISGR